ncbi:MAG: DUF3416 domain-containing protein, partial [Proteobacteria bacterium]|nr:DUF3416 domain-containing protein [Pseudomonadota bacterium]
MESTAAPSSRTGARKIYYLDSRAAGAVGQWRPHVARTQALGFDHLCIPPAFATDGNNDIFLAADGERAASSFGKTVGVDQTLGALATVAREAGLTLIVDVVLDRIAADGPLAKSLPVQSETLDHTIVDPRRSADAGHAALLRYDDATSVPALIQWWTERLARFAERGVGGFRLLGLSAVPAGAVAEIIAGVRKSAASTVFLAWTPGLPRDRVTALAGCGLDGVFASTPWWDGKASWYIEEHEALRRIAPVIAPVEVPFGERAAERGTLHGRRILKIAAATGDGLLVPMGFEFESRRRMEPRFFSSHDEPASPKDAPPLASAIVEANAMVDRLASSGSRLRSQTGPGSRTTILRRGEQTVIAIDADEVNVADAAAEPPIVDQGRARKTVLRAATQAPRIVIDNITPRVDGGNFAVKRIVGREITVEADVFMDGHDVLAVDLQWKPADDANWQHVPMKHVANDRWRATFTPARIGRWSFTVEACLDELATVRRALQLKKDAGVDFSVEASEEKALEAAGTHRAFTVRHEPPQLLDVERPQAGFASWYELFPRSITDDPRRHGTLADVIGVLPRVRDMGFDVLYFPPIHPIGRKNRKGRNNTLTPRSDDVGSVYAVGGAEGGHDALHPALGTLDDFRRLVAAARDNGLELAL